MKNCKRILGMLLVCVLLLGAMPAAVAAEGTPDNPIDAATKWFGYGVNTYLLNPTIAEGNTDGLWYSLTIEQDGILFLEHKYKDVDYTIYITLNGVCYCGGSVNGEIYNGPIVSAPVRAGDEAIITIVTQDAAAGTVYANMNVISGDADNPIKVKSSGIDVYVGAGQTVYFQDDSLNAIYATKGLLTIGDVADTTFYTVIKNTDSGDSIQTAVVDNDMDGMIEAKLGGSLGSAGAPPVKPAWAIENNSDQDRMYTLTIVDGAHECAYDDDADTDCNTCGAVREVLSFIDCAGASISEDVNGLAFKYDVKVQGMEVYGTTAVYDNATIDGLKLIGMGAVVSGTDAVPQPTLEDVNEQNGRKVINVPATYLCELNQEAGTASYAVRIINIPDERKDTTIWFRAYLIVEDADGNRQVIYAPATARAYNQV